MARGTLSTRVASRKLALGVLTALKDAEPHLALPFPESGLAGQGKQPIEGCIRGAETSGQIHGRLL